MVDDPELMKVLPIIRQQYDLAKSNGKFQEPYNVDRGLLFVIEEVGTLSKALSCPKYSAKDREILASNVVVAGIKLLQFLKNIYEEI